MVMVKPIITMMKSSNVPRKKIFRHTVLMDKVCTGQVVT